MSVVAFLAGAVSPAVAADAAQAALGTSISTDGAKEEGVDANGDSKSALLHLSCSACC